MRGGCGGYGGVFVGDMVRTLNDYPRLRKGL